MTSLHYSLKLTARGFQIDYPVICAGGQYGSKTSYHSLFNDEIGATHHLITIAGIYNHPAIPQYAIESVLYHEMLHIDCPPIEGKTRRNVHHKEFRRRERLFDHYDRWQNWLKGDLSTLFSGSLN